MLSIKTHAKIGIALALGILISACQMAGTKATVSSEAAPQAIRCDKCQITWVKVPTSDPKGRFIGYSDKKVMECPECHSAVANFFQTGKLQHTCESCGGNLTICESH